MNAELKSKKWLFFGIGLQFAVGFTVAFIIFFFGSIITGGSLGSAWMPIVGWAVVLLLVAIYTARIIKTNKQLKTKGV